MLLIKSKIYEMKLIQRTFSDAIKLLEYTLSTVNFSIQNNYKKFIYFLNRQGVNIFECMYQRIRKNRNMLTFFSSYIDYNTGLACAGCDGYPELVDRFLSLGAITMQWSLRCAVFGEHINIMQYFFSCNCKFENIQDYGYDGKIRRYVVQYMKKI